MNSERFLNAFGEIKSKYISEATKEKKNNAAAKRILLIAAVSCAAILICLSPLLSVIMKKSGNTGNTTDTTGVEGTDHSLIYANEIFKISYDRFHKIFFYISSQISNFNSCIFHFLY